MGSELVTSMQYLFGGEFSMIKKSVDKNITDIFLLMNFRKSLHYEMSPHYTDDKREMCMHQFRISFN